MGGALLRITHLRPCIVFHQSVLGIRRQEPGSPDSEPFDTHTGSLEMMSERQRKRNEIKKMVEDGVIGFATHRSLMKGFCSVSISYLRLPQLRAQGCLGILFEGTCQRIVAVTPCLRAGDNLNKTLGRGRRVFLTSKGPGVFDNRPGCATLPKSPLKDARRLRGSPHVDLGTMGLGASFLA